MVITRARAGPPTRCTTCPRASPPTSASARASSRSARSGQGAGGRRGGWGELICLNTLPEVALLRAHPGGRSRQALRLACHVVASAPAPTLILTIDLEDWHQLAARRIGLPDWDRRSSGLVRQCATLLERLQQMGARATFFVLGCSARRYPELVREIAGCGHEIASHGYAHRRVYDQTPRELAADLAASIELIGELTGSAPRGYRAPAFSITRRSAWAFELIADHGFRYDSSVHDSPRVPDRIRPAVPAPHRIELSAGRSLWELPIAVGRLGAWSIPLGGGAYWRLLPGRVVRGGLAGAARSGPQAIYAHPYECDPEPLRLALGERAPLSLRLRARLREAQRNPRRTRVLELLSALGHTYELITCEQAVERYDPDNRRAGPGALQRARA